MKYYGYGGDDEGMKDTIESFEEIDEEEEDVCCLACSERVCGFHEDPPHTDRKGEAICEGCFECFCEDQEEEEEERRWTCDCKGATHGVYRDALGETEWTCDTCHKNEYPEEYEEEEEEEEEKCRCDCCDYSISKSDFEAGKGRIMFNDLDDDGFRCGVCDDRCDEEGELLEEEEEEEEEKEEPKVIVDPEKLLPMFKYLQMTVDVTWASWMIEGFPFDNIIVKGLTDRQLEVLGRFVNRCKKSD